MAEAGIRGRIINSMGFGHAYDFSERDNGDVAIYHVTGGNPSLGPARNPLAALGSLTNGGSLEGTWNTVVERFNKNDYGNVKWVDVNNYSKGYYNNNGKIIILDEDIADYLQNPNSYRYTILQGTDDSIDIANIDKIWTENTNRLGGLQYPYQMGSNNSNTFARANADILGIPIYDMPTNSNGDRI